MASLSASQPLEGKLAVVTGASRGLGAAIARNLGSKGANILAVYTSASSTKTTADLCREIHHQYGVKAVACQTDLADPERAARDIINAVNQAFVDPQGKALVDILINNAGVGGSCKLGEISVAEFHRIYTINVLAPIFVTQALIPYLPTDRSGRIVSTSSVASSMGFAGHTLYGGSKAALEAMTRTWARELAERCTVNAIAPGPIEGDLYYKAGADYHDLMLPYQLNCPLSALREDLDDPETLKRAAETGGRRPGYCKDIASVVGMLCGPDAGWTTGSVICANGGYKTHC